MKVSVLSNFNWIILLTEAINLIAVDTQLNVSIE